MSPLIALYDLPIPLQSFQSSGSLRQILNYYTGEIIIVSSDGMKKNVSVNIVWKGISSEHFIIYARDNAEELSKAAQVINFLERSYLRVAEIVDNVESKTVIYMTSSLHEMKMLSDALAPSTYVYDEDVGFVWSNSEDLNMLALKAVYNANGWSMNDKRHDLRFVNTVEEWKDDVEAKYASEMN